MSSAVHVKELLCATCTRSFGTYHVVWHDDSIAPRVALGAVRLATGMVNWQGGSARPRLFFRVDPLGHRRDRPIDTRPVQAGAKYRWRCGCGASPAYRGDTLYGKLERTKAPAYL